MEVRIAGIVRESVVDGPGIRYAIFAQGCPHLCKSCHNPETHDMSGGSFYDISAIIGEIEDNPLLDGVTFSGGEPFCQCAAFSEIAKRLSDKYNIRCYTGYLYEELKAMNKPEVDELLSYIDVLVDGRYIDELRDFRLRFKGSSNQREIYCKKSIAEGRLVLVE
ncbi:MAG: anaerobic ribonucleoside-triphosphate reductase activating protein [Oscillospiraceae bacterium]|nr:anaerobic ribonucleoside-triphosphate reductase activating protein [Oscillospiraceae bacterium]